MAEKINAGHAKKRALVAYPSRNGGTAHGRLLAGTIDPEVSSSRGAISVVAPLVLTVPRGAPMRDDVCSIDGCDSTTFARGWCNAHYKRWYRHGDPTAPRQARTLAECAPIIEGDIARVPLTRGLYAVIDAADAAAVGARVWQAEPAGLTHYAQTNRSASLPATRLHRFVLGYGPGDPEVDHIDGDGLNCRRSNLRATSHKQNMANRSGRRGTSTFKGVRWDTERSTWAAEIKDGGRARFLGRFADEVEAARAYDQAAVEVWGEYARLNFPVDGMAGATR